MRDLSTTFTTLKYDIQKFSKDFEAYLVEEKKRLTELAAKYEADIKEAQEQIDKCVLRWLVLFCSSYISESVYHSIEAQVRCYLPPRKWQISIDS